MPAPVGGVLRATSELVAVAWIGSVPGLSLGMVATTLPADDSSWPNAQFVTVAVIGGSPNIDLPVKAPVFQVDCWACKPGSNKPPWGKANALAEVIRYATLPRSGVNRLLTITANGVTYPPATVQAARLLTEPMRRYGDAADYANYSFDLAMTWVTAGDRIA